MYYVLLDEIQLVDKFVPLLNGLLRLDNVIFMSLVVILNFYQVIL